MSSNALLHPPLPGRGPLWRVAVTRSAGRTERLRVAEVIDQLRVGGCMATEVDVCRSDAFVDHRTEWAGRAHPGAYDLIVTGSVSPAIVALAVLTDALVVCLPAVRRPSLPGAIQAALARQQIDVLPVAQVTADGDRRFTTSVVTLAADHEVAVHWNGQPTPGETSTSKLASCDVRPLGAPDGLLEVRLAGGQLVRCRHLEVIDECELRVGIESRSRSARTVVVEGGGPGVRLLRLPQRS